VSQRMHGESPVMGHSLQRNVIVSAMG
jgi:hypothetical protein